jgi:hypothetical protein
VQHLKTDNKTGRTTPNAAPQRDAQIDSCPEGNHSILQQRRTPTRQSQLQPAEASIFSRLIRHQHYTRIADNAESLNSQQRETKETTQQPRKAWIGGRFTFCCAFRRVTPPGRYPAPLLQGVRTFLEYTRDHPAIRTVCHYCGFDNSSTSNMSANFFIKAQSYPSNAPSKFVRQRLLKACKICSKVASGSKPAR